MKLAFEQKMMGLARIGLGWTFLWAFMDKLWGLGFTTLPEKSWLAGASPTMGFLKFATAGPLSGVFSSLAGQAWVDWLFMLGLLGLGIALLLGIGMRIAGYAGALLLGLMYLASIPFYQTPAAHNPFVDEHLIYAAILLAFTRIKVGRWWGFAEKWSKTTLVKANPILE